MIRSIYMNHTPAIKKTFFMFVLVAALIFNFSAETVSASADGRGKDSFPEDHLPEDGAYLIINTESGLYLTAGRDYYLRTSFSLSDYSENKHQIFTLTRQPDLTYSVISSLDTGFVAISRDWKSVPNSLTINTKESVDARFQIVMTGDGEYTISCMAPDAADLVLSGNRTRVEWEGFDGRVSSSWKLEKVSAMTIELEPSKISMAAGQKKLVTPKVFPAGNETEISFFSSDSSVAVVNGNGLITAERNGSTVITAVLGDLSATCEVEVSGITASTFYSQHNISTGGWDGVSLTNIRFSGKLFAVEGFAHNLDWMDEGCLICCYAMILNNLGATLNDGYDFRTGRTTNIEPDPYTVALANSGNRGAENAYSRLYGDPVSVQTSRLLSRFTVGTSQLTLSANLGRSRAMIKEALEEHPEGVIVEFYVNENLRHFIVFTECINPDDANGRYEFIVCDPAASDRENGDHVPFTECTSYQSIGYRYYNIVSIKAINVLSDYDNLGSMRGNRICDPRIM